MKLDKQIHVLLGNEPPELLMFWELDYKTRITKDKSMTPVTKLNIRKSLVQHDALNAVKDALELFEKATELEDINDFCNPETRLSIERLCNSEKEKKEYLTGDAHKGARVPDIINKCIYHLRLLIFGYDKLGQSSYIQLCRTIRQMKVTSSGIHMYATRLVDYQKKISRCL